MADRLAGRITVGNWRRYANWWRLRYVVEDGVRVQFCRRLNGDVVITRIKEVS